MATCSKARLTLFVTVQGHDLFSPILEILHPGVPLVVSCLGLVVLGWLREV